jgi:hypothetical protein
MIRYLFTAIGFPPGGSGRWTCAKVGKRQLYTKGETVHKGWLMLAWLFRKLYTCVHK